MTPAEEMQLYVNNHEAWCSYIAPRWRDLLRLASHEGKKALWDKASEQLRTALRALRESESQAMRRAA